MQAIPNAKAAAPSEIIIAKAAKAKGINKNRKKHMVAAPGLQLSGSSRTYCIPGHPKGLKGEKCPE